MIITKKHLPRRTLLRGVAGVTLGLPLLDSMVPALTAGPKPRSAPCSCIRHTASSWTNGVPADSIGDSTRELEV
jgi:hypothetical protein